MAQFGVYFFGMLLLPSVTLAKDAFSSMASLRSMQENQLSMLNTIDRYITKEYQRLANLRRLVEDARVHVLNYQQDIWGYQKELGNPITAYAMIRDWAAIISQAKLRDAEYELNFNQHFPDRNDHLGGLRSLLRLQMVYNISTADMVRGNIRGHQSRILLTNNDYYDLGAMAVEKRMNRIAVEWLELSINHPPYHVPQQDVYYRAADAYYGAYDFEKAVEFAQLAHELDPSNYTMRSRLDMYIEIGEAYKGQQNMNNYYNPQPSWMKNYQQLCREKYMEGGPRWFHPDVWCEYRQGLVPYAPYKLEIISKDPYITLFHDIITDSEANMMKERAKPQLLRASVGDPAKAYPTDERVSKVAWLWDHLDEGKQVTRLSRKVQDATGLSTKYFEMLSHAEPFQVVNYGMGGQYEPHVDVYEVPEHLANVPPFIKSTGDRIATFMFYLSDVVEGGATVFTKAHAYVPPVKNAAAFWFNIHRSGELDLRTQHAGCPVLIGEKWVANKWIREVGQVFRRPCGLRADSTETDVKSAKVFHSNQ